tara:strand:+ start:540 stop:752 length:213 start_codon:yes stop_codon:yes gene_type:complete
MTEFASLEKQLANNIKKQDDELIIKDEKNANVIHQKKVHAAWRDSHDSKWRKNRKIARKKSKTSRRKNRK